MQIRYLEYEFFLFLSFLSLLSLLRIYNIMNQTKWMMHRRRTMYTAVCIIEPRLYFDADFFSFFLHFYFYLFFFFTGEDIFVGFCNNGSVTKFNKFHLSPHLSHLWCHIQNTYTIFNWIFIESCDCFTMFERGNILLANWICLVISGIVLFIHFFYFYFWYFS